MNIPEPTHKPNEPSHAQRFDALLGKLLSVPKAEILKREAQYKQMRAARKAKIH